MSQEYRSNRPWRSGMAAIVLGFGVAGANVAAAQNIPPVQMAQAVQAPISFADLVERVKPAVVNISSTQKAARGPMGPGGRRLPIPPGYEEFFKRFFGDEAPQGERPLPPPGEAHALGSGFIVDAAGWVVTNAHVIGEADEIQVVLQDGTQLKATLKGKDEKTDIALLKIEPEKPLPFVLFGSSSKTRVGDWVVAVGNPFGLGGTVTAGIVSAHGRNINAGPYDDFMQIDAAINRGNSGGPTFNLAGEVVGVNTAIFSPSGGSIGIGFAIPSDMVKSVVAQLRDKGRVDRGWLGVQIQDITPDIAAGLGLPADKGALVADVLPDSPALAAGFQQGDVVLSYGDEIVDDAHELPRLVAGTEAGRQMTVTVLRSGEKKQLAVTIGAMPDERKVAVAVPPRPNSTGLGLAVTELTPDVRRQLELPDSAQGVVVTEVAPDGPAARKGIEKGDVILSVNQKSVSTSKDLTAALDQARKDKKDKVVVLFQREGSKRYVALELPA